MKLTWIGFVYTKTRVYVYPAHAAVAICPLIIFQYYTSTAYSNQVLQLLNKNINMVGSEWKRECEREFLWEREGREIGKILHTHIPLEYSVIPSHLYLN